LCGRGASERGLAREAAGESESMVRTGFRVTQQAAEEIDI
jgi:hypothetical protein